METENPSVPPAAAPSGARCGVHPERESAVVCGRCGTFACTECARTTGHEPLCAACDERIGIVPWERRRDPGMGLARAFWQTARDSILRPSTLFAQRYRERNALPAIAYGLAVVAPLALVGLLESRLGLDLGSVLERLVPGRQAQPDPIDPVIVQIASIVLLPLIYPLGLLAKAGLWHLALRLVGVGRGAFDRTLRTFAYTEATSLLGALPLVGQPLALLVGAVYACIALTAAHDAEWWRVVIAGILVATFLFGLCLGCALLFTMSLLAIAAPPG